MSDCIFCKIVSGEAPSRTVWEDASSKAFLSIEPINPGHLLLIPKTHIDEVQDMSDAEYSGLFLAAKKLSKALKAEIGSKRVGIVVEGFGVAHAHIHVVPINSGNELDPNRAKKVPATELDAMAAKLTQSFKNLA